jgi:hypothetical protein
MATTATATAVIGLAVVFVRSGKVVIGNAGSSAKKKKVEGNERKTVYKIG